MEVNTSATICGRCGHEDRLPIVDGFCPDCTDDQEQEEEEIDLQMSGDDEEPSTEEEDNC